MNKQALAFLTMFSLILMLSVYYVTLPSDTTVVMKTNENSNSEAQGDQKSDTEDADQMKLKIDEKQEEEVKKQSEVISNKDASDEDKQKALQTMDDLKNDQTLSQTIVAELLAADFKGVVEIIEGTCKVSIFEKEDNAQNAKTVMDIVNRVINGKYLIEVSFK